MARKDFVAFYFLLYSMWGCLILNLMAQNITKMRKRIIKFFFPTTKIPCGKRWDETRGSTLILENGRMRTSKKKPPKRGGKKKKLCWEIQQINQNHMNGMSKSGYSRKMFFYMKKVQPKQKQNRKISCKLSTKSEAKVRLMMWISVSTWNRMSVVVCG